MQDYFGKQSYEPECSVKLQEKDYLGLLQNALLRLSPRQRQVFMMSRDRNLSHNEIAEKLGLSVYTVQEYMSDSLKSIKDYLSKHSDIVFPMLFIIMNIF